MSGSTAEVNGAVVDLARLAAWMTERGLGHGPIENETVLSGGTQNVLVRFRRAGREYVLRRGPEHKRASSDATMVREARVLATLKNSRVAHPRLIAGCADVNVIGAAFYLMEPIDGFNPTIEVPELFVSQALWQRDLGFGIVDEIAKLGRIDPVSAGLADLGKPEGWLERQVPRWRKQLEGYVELTGDRVDTLAHVDDVGNWLTERQPSSHGWQPGLMHGDFHLANVLADRTAPAVAAIVDWELASLGDPLLDLGQLLATWPRSAHPTVMAPATPLVHLPTDDELVARYEQHSGRVVTDVTWFRVLACYRLAILIEGTYVRALAGKADMTVGELSHQRAQSLLTQAMNLIDTPSS